MDGQVIAIIVSAVGVGSTIGGGFWKLGRAIGRLEGKVEGLDRRLERLGQRINGFFVGREGNG
jgi:hypothetical protein